MSDQTNQNNRPDQGDLAASKVAKSQAFSLVAKDLAQKYRPHLIAGTVAMVAATAASAFVLGVPNSGIKAMLYGMVSFNSFLTGGILVAALPERLKQKLRPKPKKPTCCCPSKKQPSP